MLRDMLWLENTAGFKLGSVCGQGRAEGTVADRIGFRALLCKRLRSTELAYFPPASFHTVVQSLYGSALSLVCSTGSCTNDQFEECPVGTHGTTTFCDAKPPHAGCWAGVTSQGDVSSNVQLISSALKSNEAVMPRLSHKVIYGTRRPFRSRPSRSQAQEAEQPQLH